MKHTTLLVTGSRSIKDERVVAYVLCQIVHDLGGVDEVLHGDAIGVDKLAGGWAQRQGIVVRTMAPDLSRFPYRSYGSRAYLERDRAMVEQVTHVVAIWDGQSTGTKHTFEHARLRGNLHSIWSLQHIVEEIGLS